jgi:hypothetical protein
MPKGREETFDLGSDDRRVIDGTLVVFGHTACLIGTEGVGFKSLSDPWADTTTAAGRLMVTVPAGIAEFERTPISQRTVERPACKRAAILRSAAAESGCCSWAAEPFVEPDAAEPRFAQRHERTLLYSATPVWGLRVAYDLTRIADRL